MRRINAALLILIALFMPVMAWAADPATRPSPRRLIVEQSAAGDAVWLAEVTAGPDGERTVIWERAGGESLWHAVADIPAGVQELAAAGGRLAALLPDGQWQSVNFATGQPLPSGARLISLAGEAENLLALGRVASPATVPVSTQASTPRASLPVGLHLFAMQRGTWRHVAAVPPGVDGEPGRTLALAFAERRPTIVTVGASQLIKGVALHGIAVWQWDKDRWNHRSQWTDPAAISAIHVFDSLDCVAVWTAADNELGQVRILVGEDRHELKFAGQAPVRDVSHVGGMIRVFYADGDKIKERRFDPRKLKEEGSAAEVRLPRLGEEPIYLKWVQGGMLALLVMTMGAAMMRRGKQPVKIDFKKVRLAPVSRRLLAGVIDAIPLLVGAMWVVSNHPQFREFRELPEFQRMPEMLVQSWLVIGIYLGILTVTEVFFGRSMGKMVTGLRVLRLDGVAPGAVALLVRNVLRVIDFGMSGVTLVLILMMPLRQRLGDIAAGTVVVADLPDPDDDLGDDDDA